MMHWMKSGFGISIVMTLIGGCATSGDPSQGGLAGGLYGISSGTYNQRIEERQAELEATKRNQQGVQQEYKQLASDKADKLRQKQKLDAELVRIKGDSSLLSAQLQQLKVGNRGGIQKKAELQKRIQQMNVSLEQLKQQSAAQRTEVTEYQRKATLLNNEIEQLWEIFHTLE